MDNSNDPNSSNKSNYPPASAPSDIWPTPDPTSTAVPAVEENPTEEVNSAATPTISDSPTPPSSDPWLTPAQPEPAAFPEMTSDVNASSGVTPNDPIATSIPSEGNSPQMQPSSSTSQPFTPDIITSNQMPSEPTTSTPEPTPMPAEPAISPSVMDGGLTPDSSSSWNSSAQNMPTPTFTPPPPSTSLSDTGQSESGNQPSPTNMDNPWNTPTQPPPIEQPQSPAQPSWTSISTEQPAPADQNSSPPPVPTEAAPTDLSHLISSNQSESASAASETLFVPSNAPQAPEVPNLQTANHKPIPKWLIGLGGLLLLVVIGASAYFILGIGRSTETTSLPATTTSEKNEAKPAAAVSTPAAQAPTQPESANSGNFGELQGSGSQGNQQATSAAEILRQRQQQGR